jgi:hypothetical protein
VTENIEGFLVELSLEECLSRLKALPDLYYSVALNISLRQIDSDTCQFQMRALGAAKNTMNLTLWGRLQRVTATSTRVSIEDIARNRLGYWARYVWIGSPIILLMALILNDPRLLLGVPVAGVLSLMAVVFELQDRDELTKIIDRALDHL